MQILIQVDVASGPFCHFGPALPVAGVMARQTFKNVKKATFRFNVGIFPKELCLTISFKLFY